MNKKKFSTYNDGIVYLYREKSQKSGDSFAKKNVSSINDLEFIVKLNYEESSKREQDIEFAEQNGFSLSLKVKTRFVKNVDNKCKAVIDGYLYDVSHMDKTRTEMWLFLEGVRELDS